MPAPAADRTKRFAWLAGAACLVCCLLPIAGVTGVVAAISLRDVLIAALVTVAAGAVAWWARRRRHRCGGTDCACN